MMERLTQKSKVRPGWYKLINPPPESCSAAIDRLGEYEDLEEQGLLVRLPCKVGDAVYYINTRPHIALHTGVIYEAVVVRIVVTNNHVTLVIQIRNDYGCTEIPDIDDIGKTVFLTREEAEAALRKMKQSK